MDYSVGIHGTSNLHEWDEKLGNVNGSGVINWNNDGTFDLNALAVKMEVRSIISSEGATMNNNTYKALKADTYPNILFELVTPVKSISGGPGGQDITARVKLTIAGVTRIEALTVSAMSTGRNNVIFEGSKTLMMTDYNIEPPVALFRTIKTGNEITVHFRGNFVIIP